MKYCELMLKELSFNLTGIAPCCTPFSFGAPLYSLENFDIQEQKRNMIHLLNNDIDKYSCKNCIYMKEDINLKDESIINSQISSIYLRHWTKCNCDCIYCDNKRGNVWNKEPEYNPYEFIKAAYEKGYIDKENLVVKVQGGDLSVLPNFDDFMNLFEKNGFKAIHFSTNNLIYQPRIEQILKAGKGSLNVSIDCGTKETYKKIKGVDKFKDCINNLKRYVSNAGKFSENISIHYILISGYNDNEHEIKNFFKLMKKNRITNVGIRIDHKDLDNYLFNKTPIENINKYKKLITLFYNLTNKYSFIADNDSSIELNFVLKNYIFSENIFNKAKNLFKKIHKN